MFIFRCYFSSYVLFPVFISFYSFIRWCSVQHSLFLVSLSSLFVSVFSENSEDFFSISCAVRFFHCFSAMCYNKSILLVYRILKWGSDAHMNCMQHLGSHYIPCRIVYRLKSDKWKKNAVESNKRTTKKHIIFPIPLTYIHICTMHSHQQPHIWIACMFTSVYIFFDWYRLCRCV